MSESSAPIQRSQSREIGDAIARLTREGAGRGPVSARTIIDGNAIIVLLHDWLTKAEQTLVDNGHVAEVMAFRRAFQDTMRPTFVREIERVTGRRVATFMSTNQAEPDRAVEVFLLEDEAAS